MKKHVVAIVGNPNCGKTTLFNALTGARQRVGNWPGVTVEKRSGFYTFADNAIEVVDLPGTYCLDVVDSDVSLDEKVARDYILKREADLIINILDASNIERNLYLTTQLLDMGAPVIVVLNMMDVAREKGMDIDIDKLAEELGCPVLPLVASKAGNIKVFLQNINDFLNNGISVAPPLNLGEQLEQAIAVIESTLEASVNLDSPLSRRWYALKLLEGDTVPLPELTWQVVNEATRQRHIIEAALEEDLDIILASRRYDVVGQLMESVIRERGVVSHRLSESIDRVVLNRVLGFPIFLGVMYLMFMFTINFGSAFIDFFDIFTGTLLVDGLGHWLNSVGAPAWAVTLLADGVGGGIQTVSTFIPVIAFLFLFLSILEDSGYMARAAFVIDRLMRFLGLPGKAFVPMLVGFGCNVPAIMAARTLDNEKDRLLTISMAPFMSCGARLPVYALFAAAFFPESGQNVVFILYLVGILAAIFTGLILKQSILSGDSSPFIMELPNYHLPSVTQVMLRTWDRLKAFILRAGKAIVMVVVVLNTLNAIGTDGSFGHQNTQNSMLSKIGQTITPVFAPMGMTEENWPAAVGLFTGILAKEAVVGTLDSMYGAIAASENADTEGETTFDLLAGLQEAIATIPANLSGLSGTLADPLGVEVGDLTDLDAVAEEQAVRVSTFSVMAGLFPSHAAVIAYLLMILLYTPCVAALGAIYRETTLGWTLFISGWTFFLGYAVATIYYQLSLISVQPGETLLWVVSIMLMMFIVVTLMKRMGASVLQGRMDVSPQ
ncbi:Fe(2+) transporter permease subunit FeoB [Thalassotalea sp. G20_0]|uniref:Fe(2+) transporter permease subunit FeoB n=1 Tax=Thalassotalea sp. G20_0 TaxID=2821093 RepID=UPI001ADA9E9C|nr:Fe(2+) transporter permease subunit FeoB [Thalassotalea sp. G20_0]MBO9496048.1 Fe(2+) transporter permease subunit FeoB [Thalassotalea sp. G20_0]